MHTDILQVAHIRGYTACLAIACVGGLAILAMPIEIHPVLGRTGVFNYLWPMALPIVGIALMPILRARRYDIVVVSPYRRERACLDFACGGACVLLSIAIARAGVLPIDEVGLGALFYGMFVVAVYPLAGSLSWMPPLAFAFLVWLLGSDMYGTPRPWAVTLPGATPQHQLAAIVLLGASGGIIRVWHKLHPIPRRRETWM
ncbi:hypothetical protein I6E29_03845 [Arcanobacterium haemolyticum]|nr:hypothetical protein [Arcanobacterium haemolyticum]